MKNLTLIIFSLLAFAACQEADEIASPAGTPSIEQRSQTRPFHADLSGSLNPDSAPTACTGDAPLALLDYFITGNATHMGQLNASQSNLHHDDCNLNVATMLLTTGVSGQLIASNGDAVYYTGDDAIDVFNFLTGQGPNGPITGTWTITGGTGRFEDASGTITINGIVDFATLSFTAEADGTITY
jgi:hypothetical protein